MVAVSSRLLDHTERHPRFEGNDGVWGAHCESKRAGARNTSLELQFFHPSEQIIYRSFPRDDLALAGQTDKSFLIYLS